MKKIKLSGSNIDVSVISYGVADFGTQINESNADQLISAYIEAGGNLLDTAHCYAFWEKNGLGASERALGASLKRLGCRDSVYIVSKGGHPDGGPAYQRPKEFLSETTISKDIDESLDRLGFDVIDVYFLHRDDGHTPVSEIIEMLNSHVKAGKIRTLGASNWSADRMDAANRYAESKGLLGFSVSQDQVSLVIPDWKITADPTNRYIDEDEVVFHTRTQIPVMAYSATAGGYFAGRGHDSGTFARPENTRKYERCLELSKEIGCTPTQVAIAWLLHQSYPVIPLFSSGSMDHVKEVMSSEKVELSSAQTSWLSD